MTVDDSCFKMPVIYLILLVIGTTRFVSGAESESDPYCFQFTWLGRTPPADVNCTELKNTPCVTPFVVTHDGSSPPNVTKMWEFPNRTNIRCPLNRGFACLKYTYIYNNAPLNITYFCGKMIEDKTFPISSGCFVQKVDGHTVEACACQSGGGVMPCNSSTTVDSSINILFILTSISMLFSKNLLARGLDLRNVVH